jgi:hypothetical protein
VLPVSDIVDPWDFRLKSEASMSLHGEKNMNFEEPGIGRYELDIYIPQNSCSKTLTLNVIIFRGGGL